MGDVPADAPGRAALVRQAQVADAHLGRGGVRARDLDAGEALHWPCPEPGHPGTPRLFLDRFAHPDGRARLVPVDHVPAAELPDDPYPLRATTGRVLVHYQSGAQTRRVEELAAVVPESLRFCFDLCTRDTAAAGAELAIDWVQGRARCRRCDAMVSLDRPWGRCACGGEDLEVLSGHELIVKDMEVE